MINCLTKNFPYVNHTGPENKIEAIWLMDEIIRYIKCLHLKGFNVKTCVYDNHPTNLSAYRKLLVLYGNDEDGVRIFNEDKAVYLIYDAVLLIKNIRNNLLPHKKLMFPPFLSNHLGGKPDEVKGGEIS